MIQSILFGNGINRLSKGVQSWDDMIKSISKNELDKNIPNPLKYEAILMEQPYQDASSNDSYQMVERDNTTYYVRNDLSEMQLKRKIATELQSFPSNEVYDSLSKMPVGHYITTNYDHTLFKSFSEGYTVKALDRTEKLYSIRRNYSIRPDSVDGSIQYWPMHGDMDSPASIMLGFDHYCGALSKIEQYVKGDYSTPNRRIDSMTRRLGQGVMPVFSWVDLFFISDIHIIGINLGYEELDLWWLLNRRRRVRQSNSELIRNKITYYPVEPLRGDLSQMLSGFDVEIKELDKALFSKDDNFLVRYKTQVSNINSSIQQRM